MIIPKEIFRAYDIRGVVDEQLTESLVLGIGQALATQLLALNQATLVVGCDGRLSSPGLKNALIEGVNRCGVDVIDIGQVTSPMLYFATCHLSANSGVMITGSHNPMHYNGLKIVVNGQTLKAEGISEIYHTLVANQFPSGEGQRQQQDIRPAYQQAIVDRIQLKRPLKVVLDCGNGIAGETAPAILEALGCEVIPLFCEVDGRFPNHHPDPNRPENLVDCQQAVKKYQADCALALDGDADRLGVVTESGDIIWPDRQMMLFSESVLANHPNQAIVFDVKCSAHLATVIQAAGGRPVMAKTGHSLLKARMIAEQAPLAGEMSGHIFFADQWFGFDDGLYAGCRLLALLAASTQSLSQFFINYPNSVSTPEIMLPVNEATKFTFMQQLVEQGVFPGATKNQTDGLRLEYQDGWALVRASNTTACLTLRFEGDSHAVIERMQAEMKAQLHRIDPQLTVCFKA